METTHPRNEHADPRQTRARPPLQRAERTAPPTVSGRGTVRRAHTGMLFWALIVGLSFPAVGLMSEGLPPLFLTALRFAIAALALWPLVRGEPDRLPAPPALALYGALGLCLAGFFGAMFWAAQRSSAVSMASLYVTVPALAYGLGRWLGVEPRASRLALILAVGAAGALLLAWAEAGGQSGVLRLGLGEAVFFAGCAASALYPVLSKWGLERRMLSPSAGLRTFWSLACGAVLIGLAAIVFEPARSLALLTASDALLLGYLGIISSGVTFWLQQRATAALSPGVVTGYSYLVPFVSMLLLFIGETQRLGWHWLPGSVLVLVATALLLRTGSAAQMR